MHPLGLYLAITDHQREHGWTPDDDRRPAPAPVGAKPTTEPGPEPVSRLARLAAILRRRVAPVARA